MRLLCGQIAKKQEFEEKGYYTWIYEGPQAMSNLMTFLIIAGFLAITCFPIWPHFLKVQTHLHLGGGGEGRGGYGGG